VKIAALGQHCIERMTWPEVGERIDAGVDAVLIPIGTTEQHGHHMPLDTDCFIARALAERAAQLGEEQGSAEAVHWMAPTAA
jgi:creatinine amidohydrolase/Fe(II)-dependent formamide hydrolase-like protein